jgi:molecular chaperone DnaK (HSP70)
MVRSGNRNHGARKTRTILHVGVDFGTTFSAAGYIYENVDQVERLIRDINAVTKYPAGERYSAKDANAVPTLVAYRIGQKEPVAWGWDALWHYKRKKADLILASRFKLLLAEKDNSKNIRQKLREKLLRDGRTQMDVFLDFLRPLREHILKYIQTTEEGAQDFATWEHRWTLTVPADWSPTARRFMLEAAEMAGFSGTVKLISEPEAAALYILEQRAQNGKPLSVSGRLYALMCRTDTIFC